MSQTTQIAVIAPSAPQQVAKVNHAQRAAAIFSRSSKSEAVPSVDAKALDEHVTRQELADYEETTRRMKPEHIAQAQKLMQRFGSADLRRVVAERGLGSNVWVMDMAGRLNMHIEKLEAQVADLQRRGNKS